LLVLAILLVFFLVLPLLSIKKQATSLTNEAQGIYQGIQSQDLNLAVAKVDSTRVEFGKLNSQYRKMAWLKVVPLVRGYYLDGAHIFAGGKYLLDVADIVVESLGSYGDIFWFRRRRR